MNLFLSSVNKSKNYKNQLSQQKITIVNYINPKILNIQEHLIRNGLTKLVEESKKKKLKKNKKYVIQNDKKEINHSDSNYNDSENYENESSDDYSFEEMSVDEIIENLFMKENYIKNDKHYKRSLVISNLEEFKYKYCKKHMNRNEKECAICFEEFNDFDRVKLFSCKQHIFHKECIMKWLLNKDYCPLCKKTIIY
jgi:hypothetical protein